jgi:hypothetical protein
MDSSVQPTSWHCGSPRGPKRNRRECLAYRLRFGVLTGFLIIDCTKGIRILGVGQQRRMCGAGCLRCKRWRHPDGGGACWNCDLSTELPGSKDPFRQCGRSMSPAAGHGTFGLALASALRLPVHQRQWHLASQTWEPTSECSFPIRDGPLVPIRKLWWSAPKPFSNVHVPSDGRPSRDAPSLRRERVPRVGEVRRLFGANRSLCLTSLQ